MSTPVPGPPRPPMANQPTLEPDVIGPPKSGHPEIDAALESLSDLSDQPLGEHHDHLAQVHETLHAVLNSATQ